MHLILYSDAYFETIVAAAGSRGTGLGLGLGLEAEASISPRGTTEGSKGLRLDTSERSGSASFGLGADSGGNGAAAPWKGGLKKSEPTDSGFGLGVEPRLIERAATGPASRGQAGSGYGLSSEPAGGATSAAKRDTSNERWAHAYTLVINSFFAPQPVPRGNEL